MVPEWLKIHEVSKKFPELISGPHWRGEGPPPDLPPRKHITAVNNSLQSGCLKKFLRVMYGAYEIVID